MTLSGLLGLAVHRLIRERLDKVRQALIDAEFVVEERVENYKPETKSIAVSGHATPIVEILNGNEADMGENGDWEDADGLDIERNSEGEGDEFDGLWFEEDESEVE